jgi:methylenetetrahydrofolate dehydrogenase (NAD+)
MKAVFNEEKDVEGLSHTWIKRMYHNIRWLDDAKTKKAILPCTPLAVIKVLKIRTPLISRSWNTSAHTT